MADKYPYEKEVREQYDRANEIEPVLTEHNSMCGQCKPALANGEPWDRCSDGKTLSDARDMALSRAKDALDRAFLPELFNDSPKKADDDVVF